MVSTLSYELLEKQDNLKNIIKDMGSVAVAFSSGVDSTYLLSIAHEVLEKNVIAVTARSCSFPQRELNEAVEFCKKNNIEHLIIDSEELEIEGFSDNPVNRCYLCKSELFSKIKEVAKQKGISEVIEGSNMDDNGDYRPGLIAIRELNIKSPLRIAKLYKNEIRELSKAIGLTTWEKPSFACLSSRFPYGEKITKEKLGMVDKAEQLLIDMGIRQVRVRHHGELARIEVDENDFTKLLEKKDLIIREFKNLGYTYVSLDLQGYRMGSMNENIILIPNKKK